MEHNNTHYREIDFNIDSCPPEWCPLIKLALPRENCCHGCSYFGEEGFYEKVFCEHPVANKEIPLIVN